MGRWIDQATVDKTYKHRGLPVISCCAPVSVDHCKVKEVGLPILGRFDEESYLFAVALCFDHFLTSVVSPRLW